MTKMDNQKIYLLKEMDAHPYVVFIMYIQMKFYSIAFTGVCRVMETLFHHTVGHFGTFMQLVRDGSQPHETCDSLILHQSMALRYVLLAIL